MEKASGVAVRDRVSGEQVLRHFVDQSTMDLEGGAPPKRKSPLLPLKLLGALELLVVDSSQPLYARGLAFFKLLKLWTAARSHDLSGLNPVSLRWTPHGLVGCLARTKTTGPGKRVRHLPVFVKKSAFFMAPSWLSIGLDVWRHADMNFDRDYFLPLPRSDWEGVRKCMADYGDVVGLTKLLLRQLKVPIWSRGVWIQSDSPLLSSGRSLQILD